MERRWMDGAAAPLVKTQPVADNEAVYLRYENTSCMDLDRAHVESDGFGPELQSCGSIFCSARHGCANAEQRRKCTTGQPRG